VTISGYLVDGMRIIRVRMFVCPYTPIFPDSLGYSPPYDHIYGMPYIPLNIVCKRVCTYGTFMIISWRNANTPQST